jgi:hypothetical protein
MEKPIMVLQLDAVDRWVTYRKVLYWVNAKNATTAQGRVLRGVRSPAQDCPLPGFPALGGAIRPTRLIVEDALRKGHRSELEYSNMVMRDLPDMIFTKNYLKKLSR